MLLKRYYKPNQTSVDPLWQVRDEFNELFGSNPFGGLLPQKENDWKPSLDVVEEKERYLVKLEIPGIKRDDVKITFEDGVLHISGERKEEKSADENKVHLSERYFGTFERAIRFPNPVEHDKVSAKFTDGVLEITLPKPEETKPRQIEINAE